MPAHRSACPHCKTRLKAVDLVPVFSWLFLKGRCRYCGQPIAALYPLTEIGVVLGCLVIYVVLGLSVQAILLCLVVPFLAALLVIDLQEMILPNQLVLILAVFGAVFLALKWVLHPATPLEVLFVVYGGGALLYGAFSWFLGWIMTAVLKRESLGFGDVKFFAAAGLWLGIYNLPWFCILAGILGLVFALFWRLAGKGAVFPFGPALIAAFYVMMVYESSQIS